MKRRLLIFIISGSMLVVGMVLVHPRLPHFSLPKPIAKPAPAPPPPAPSKPKVTPKSKTLPTT